MTFTTDSGRPVAVGQRLAIGGEGEIFTVTLPPGTVFKKYLPIAFSRDHALEQRLRVMAANRPVGWREPLSGHVTLAWPTEIVLENRRFAGFLMPAVDMNATVEVHRVTNPSDRRSATGTTSWAQKFTWKYLVYTAANLARATQDLHDAGVVIGDFNERNVRVSLDASVTLLDCDSMQVTDPATGKRLFCQVGRPEFTPPELMNADWSKTVRHPSSDLFALAIHIYQLLLEGEHPFRGVWSGPGDKPSVSELARQGDWAHKSSGLLRPRPSAIPITLLPTTIMEMFRKAFEDGATNPAARPPASDWERALGELASSLRECAAHPAHVYPSTLNACPWCSRIKRSTQQQRLKPLTGTNNPAPVTVAPQLYGPYGAPTTAGTPYRTPAVNTIRVNRPRRLVKMLVVLAVIGAVSIVANALSRSHANSPGAPATDPSSAAATPDGPSGSTAVGPQDQATQVDQLLQKSAATRTTLSNSYDEVANCSDVTDGLSGLQQVASQRNSEITEAQALQTGDLTNGADLQSDLIKFLQDSLAADNDFVTWAQDESSSCTSAANDEAYNAGMAESGTAVSDKNSFLSLWDPIARNQGLAIRTQADL